LQHAGPRTEIRVLDANEYRGQLLIDDPSRWEGLKITGTGETVLSAATPQTVVHIAGTPGVEIRGFQMKLDQAQHGFEITGNCPGVVIEDLSATRTARSGRKSGNVGFLYAHDGASGAPGAHIVLRRLDVRGGTVGLVIGEQSEPSSGEPTPVRWIQIEECRIAGADVGDGYLLIFLNSIQDVSVMRNIFALGDCGISLATPRPMQVQGLHIINNTFYKLNQLMVFGASSVEQEIGIRSNLILRTRGIDVNEAELNSIASKWFSGNWWEATVDVDVAKAGRVAEMVGSVPVASTEMSEADFLRPVTEELLPYMKAGDEIPGRHGGKPHEKSDTQ
jgi:hypothetical protein